MKYYLDIGKNLLKLNIKPYRSSWYSWKGSRKLYVPETLDSRIYISLALDDNEFVGLFKFWKSNNGISARGTYVRGPYRGNGVGRTLWKNMINNIKPYVIDVYIVSNEGFYLVSSLAKEYPDIVWKVNDKRSI